MVKKIDYFTLDVTKDGETINAQVRYYIQDDVNTDLKKFGQMDVEITSSNSLDSVLLTVENQIKTQEGIT